jgi:hypothetical protein
MGLKKGMINNPTGRPKGVQNRVTTEIKEVINQFINDNIGNLQNEFNNLESKDKLRFLIDLLPYVIPKLQSLEVKDPIEQEIKTTTIIFRDYENE